VQSDYVEQITNTNIDWWVLLLIVLMAGFLIPSPQEIARGIRDMFRRTTPA
tara:strand:+ start:139 stop:291 length:153 start_codon:yes stop_codon:yes gene_type:complete